MDIKTLFTKAGAYYRRNGAKATIAQAIERFSAVKLPAYEYEEPDLLELVAQKKSDYTFAPKISLVIPVYDPLPEYFWELLESIKKQSYSNFEAIFALGGRQPQINEMIDNIRDRRFKFLKLENNLGISGNTNAAINSAIGDYIGFVDQDDFLTPDCLFEFANIINECATRKDIIPDIVYSDEDKFDGKRYFCPHKKVSFNLDMFLTNNYLCHLTLINRKCLGDIRLRPEFDGAQDYDLLLQVINSMLDADRQVSELTKRIRHIPKVLYHWRTHEGSCALSFSNKTYACDAGKRALASFFATRNIGAKIICLVNPGFYYIYYDEPWYQNRPDIAAIGGPMSYSGLIKSGAFTRDGKVLYENMPLFFEGPFHRMKLLRNVYALDIRSMLVRPELGKLHEQYLAKLKDKSETIVVRKISTLGKTRKSLRYSRLYMKLVIEISLAFAKVVHDKGYLFLYDPQQRTRDISL